MKVGPNKFEGAMALMSLKKMQERAHSEPNAKPLEFPNTKRVDTQRFYRRTNIHQGTFNLVEVCSFK